jgi:hypothetical protein
LHTEALTAFLTTDLYRLDAALEEQTWSGEASTRLSDHLHRLAQLVALARGAPSTGPDEVHSIDAALEALHSLTHTLLDTVAVLPETRLSATVLDPHERGLSLLAHLYDYARLSAALVEWSRCLPPPPSVDDWFLDDGA